MPRYFNIDVLLRGMQWKLSDPTGSGCRFLGFFQLWQSHYLSKPLDDGIPKKCFFLTWGVCLPTLNRNCSACRFFSLRRVDLASFWTCPTAWSKPCSLGAASISRGKFSWEVQILVSSITAENETPGIASIRLANSDKNKFAKRTLMHNLALITPLQWRTSGPYPLWSLKNLTYWS